MKPIVPANKLKGIVLKSLKRNAQFCLVLISLLLIYAGCAPYSLPDKHPYAPEKDPYNFYMESQAAYQSGDYPLALKKIDQAIKLNSNMAKFYLLRGDVYKKMFRDDQAMLAYQTAVNKRSNYTEAHLAIGDLFLKQAKYEEAIKAYKKITVLEPGQNEMLLKIAQAYILWDEYPVALYNLETYRKNAEEHQLSLSDEYYMLLGEVLFKTGKFQESIVELDKVKTENIRVLKLFGLAYYGLESYEKGMSYFNKLLNLDKDNGEWYYYRGIYYYVKNKPKDAAGQFNHALQLDNTLYESHYYMGKIQQEQGQADAALSEFRRYRQYSTNPERLAEVNAIITTMESSLK
ncbi:MAG: tetratricopeptide repeat protein [Calditrichales bacterium]|nr:MAG: tetratricopeptide repeat protein [Calditrichales bacterium]